ncbi:MAG TPA: phospholipase D-like domain-containing protein, partial [Xanthobacteraceae bacterium]|nr:phospholipase D-like domain-containing protein [Xanthobacteraceae bacterium]
MAPQGSLDISAPYAHQARERRMDGSRSAARGGDEILRPGRNVWRIERAGRAAVLIDGAQFFRAVREALIKAQRTIFIVGWDMDSRCRLVGENCDPDDGMPASFAEFLSALARERPELKVNLLLWDYSVVYALEREVFPTMSLHWSTPRQVQLCLDDELPIGSSHHQKIIVIDDAVAFSGGIDLTIRRWDTSDHSLDNTDRVDPFGKPYGPFHDVQAMVDGAAARALAELVRERWARASCDSTAAIEPLGDPWPDSVDPDFRDIDVGIARTLPLYQDQDEVREVEELFCDSICAAQNTIYIENQFVTCTRVGEHLARTLRRRPELEALIVGPRNYGSWIESHTMRSGRIRFLRMLEDAGVSDRVRFMYPEVRAGDRISDTMIHSKVCIVDDRLLRVGSANLNNRSMGADTECDLAFAARTPEQRQRILHIRNKLVGEHCGVGADEIAAALERTGSLIRTVTEVSDRGHRLCPIADGELEKVELGAAIEEVADPSRPLAADLVANGHGPWFSPMQMSTIVKIVLVGLALLALPLIWRYTPLATWADPAIARGALAGIVDNAWAPLLVVAIFVAAGLVAFPVTVLIAVTAATFGPALGFTYAAVGALTSALVTYMIGAWLGKDMLRDLMGPRLDRIRRRIVNQGVIAVAAVRLVPVAPFT